MNKLFKIRQHYPQKKIKKKKSRVLSNICKSPEGG